MKFVVIGGDAAGMSAASRAKRNQPELDVNPRIHGAQNYRKSSD